METMKQQPANEPKQSPWYRTARAWKRLAVFISIIFSICTLILGAIASLHPKGSTMLHAITVSSIVVNSLSITLSALTSLDWQKEATHEKKFAERLLRIVHVGDGDEVVVTDREVVSYVTSAKASGSRS